MTNKELLDLMMKRLGNRQAPGMRAIMLTELNETIRMLEQADELPWFIEGFVSTTIDTTGALLLPPDFAREIDGRPFMLQVDSKWTALTKVSREKLEQESINYTGAPEGYALSGDYILFGPIPDQAYSYRLPYYKRTGGIEDTIVTVTNRWILEAQEYTTFSTLVKMGRHHIQSPELTQRFVASRNEAKDAFIRMCNAREQANMNHQFED